MLISLNYVSCGDSDDPQGGCDTNDLAALSAEFSRTGQEYLNDRTEAKCLAYREALNNFIKEAEDCPAQELQIAELKKILNELDCTNP